METKLPHTRIRTIMKSSLDTGQISNDVLFLMTKSTEIFIKYLCEKAYTDVKKTTTTLQYHHLANLVQNNDNLEFLLQIVPPKMLVKNAKVLMDQGDDSDASSSEENN